MSVDAGPLEGGEIIERMKERDAKVLKEIDQDLERVDRVIRQAEEQARKVFKLDQG